VAGASAGAASDVVAVVTRSSPLALTRGVSRSAVAPASGVRAV
jgi:hypothetical protein